MTGAVARARPSVAFVAVNTTFLWVTTIVASVALWPIYRGVSLVILIGVALIVGSAIAVTGALRRWSSPMVMAATVAAFLAIGVPLAVPHEALFGVLPSLDGLRDLVAGVALGWKQLLTISLPVGDYQALLVPALVLVLLSAVIGLSIALRSRRGEPAVIAPILLFIMATAFGPNFPSRPLDAPLALIVVVLFWLLWFRWYRRRVAVRLLSGQSAVVTGAPAPATLEPSSAGLRTVLSAALILVIASVAAVGAASVLPPTADRTVLRTTIVQPFNPHNYVSPLAGFRRYLQPTNSATVLFDVIGLPQGARIRIATMDTYNGVVFAVGNGEGTSESGSFTLVPARFDQSAVRGDRVRVGMTIAAYRGPWLPTVGKFESVLFGGDRASKLSDEFYYNDNSGTAAVLGGLTAGDSYTLEAVIPRQPTPAELAGLEPGAATVPQPANVPDAVSARLDAYVGSAQGAGPRLVAMLAGLADDGYISHGIGVDEPASRSGHAADRISELLTAPRMIGDAEQYAVTAALMAQQLGFPARVVFGFVPAGESVRGDSVSAWIEVNTAQFGWVTIDPTPQVRPIPEAPPVDNSQVARPQTIVIPPVIESDNSDRQTTPDSEQTLPTDPDPVLQLVLAALRIAGLVLLGVAIVLAPFAVVIAAKLRRRRLRRRAPLPLDRISGGWQEFQDAVLDHGLSPAASSTRSEIAAIAGGRQSLVLAAVADRAVFSPGDSELADAEKVWRAVDELQASLDVGLSRWQRIRARVSVRSLGGYSVRTLFKK